MKILIVDDQYDHKVDSIATRLKKNGVNDIEHVMYTREAYEKMHENQYDLVLLDLQLRENFGEDISTSAGVSLLELMLDDSEINLPHKIVGITCHQNAFDENKDIFQKHGYTLHLYEGEVDFIESILINSKNNTKKEDKYDVAIITALRHIEFEALLNNGLKWEDVDYYDCNKYSRTTFIDKSGISRSIIATCCPKMGMPVSSAITMKVINQFNPSLVLMTGIAAGVQGKAELGDILAADLVWDWGSGKLQDDDTDTYLNADPEPIPIDQTIAIELKDIAQRRQYVDAIKQNWPAEAPSNSLNMKVGAIASGSAVLADTKTVNLIQKQKRSVIGVEMEAFGVLTATSLSGVIPPKAIIIKSVCDFANPDKNDNWQKYAAYTSTAMAFEILKSHITFY